MAVVIETTIGDFTVDLFTDQRPQTCRNFLKLCKIKYYNWNLFHSVQNNFIAQTGDPSSTGKGGESVYGMVLGKKARYYEAEQIPKIKHDRIGLLSMVDCGNNMLGSQFFITLAPNLQSLDGQHCVFGEISEGLEIILKFNETICDGQDRPYQDIRISHTVILIDPYDDPQGLLIPNRSPGPPQEVLTSDRIGADECIDDMEGMTTEEITEVQKEKEAKARATILEIVGDIPDADMAPPENVLFVCKLNPVTNDDDLEIIFSRFGEIVGCEVIRDRQSGDSLQYAFIEFTDRKSCEEAYLKMNNVLIDDRRIHVDFSQSVAKVRWRGKGKGFHYLTEENVEKRKENYKRTFDKTFKRKDKYNKKNQDSSDEGASNSYGKESIRYQFKKEKRKKFDYKGENKHLKDKELRKSDTYDREKNYSHNRSEDRRKDRVRSRSKDRENICYDKHFHKNKYKNYDNYKKDMKRRK